MTLASRQLQFGSAFAFSSQICDRGLLLPGSLNGERNEGVQSFEPVLGIELRISPLIQVRLPIEERNEETDLGTNSRDP